MGVLSLGVWGLSIPAATTCQAMLPVISSPAVATGIYWLLMFVTGEGGVQPGCRLICRWKAAVSIFLACICRTTRCQAVMCCGKPGFPHSVPRNCQGRGRHRKAWEFCLLASFNRRNTLYLFHVYMHLEKGCLKRMPEITER